MVPNNNRSVAQKIAQVLGNYTNVTVYAAGGNVEVNIDLSRKQGAHSARGVDDIRDTVARHYKGIGIGDGESAGKILFAVDGKPHSEL